MRSFRVAGLLLVTAAATALAQMQGLTCPELVRTAMTRTAEECRTTGRNQACYGHIVVEAESQPGASGFVFEQMGDIIDIYDLHRLRLSPMNLGDGSWGVALMRLQASLPNTIPGQNVTMLVFGNTEIENALNSSALPIEVSTSSNVIIRSVPSTSGAMLTTAQSGSTLLANGRTPNGDWLRVYTPNHQNVGWIYGPLASSADDLSALEVVDLSTYASGPLQAFYLRTGAGGDGCGALPQDGALLQTPTGAGTVRLMINEVVIDLGSTLYFQLDDRNELTVNVVEGAARVQSADVAKTVVAGGRVRVPIGAELRASGPPSALEPYSADLQSLALDGLERPVEVARPLTPEEARLIEQNAEAFGLANVEDYVDLLNELRNLREGGSVGLAPIVTTLIPTLESPPPLLRPASEAADSGG